MDVQSEGKLLNKLVEVSASKGIGVLILQNKKGQEASIVLVNNAICKITGYSKKELLKLSLKDIVTPEKYLKILKYYRSRQKGKKAPLTYEIKIEKKDSHEPLLLSIIPAAIKFNGEVATFIYISDITKKRAEEDRLRESEEKFRNIFNKGPLGMVTVGRDMRYLSANKSFCNMVGYSRSELRNLTISDITHPDYIKKDVKNVKNLISGKIERFQEEKQYIRKDKKTIWALITATVIRDKSGNFNYLLTMVEDITKRKMFESRQKEIDKAKDDFVSIASHQLRTPLGISKWYIEALKEGDLFKKDADTASKYLNVIEEDNERLIMLINDLLSVSRIEQFRVPDNPLKINVAETTRSIIRRLDAIAVKRKIRLKFIDKTSTAIRIKIDQERFKEVLECLISNAIKYSDIGGQVLVFLNKHGGNLKLTVRDVGITIKKADKKKIFAKFFRSDEAVKRDSEGTGLGLFVAKSYIEGWGGRIAFNSIPKKYTKFWFTLPCSKLGT